jgi:hypothetical protein
MSGIKSMQTYVYLLRAQYSAEPRDASDDL